MKELLQEDYKLENNNYISLREILEHQKIENKLVVPLGKEKEKYHYIDFNDIPCLLVTGETGSGKSVFLDSIIVSLMMKNTSKEIKFIMMDPKKIELGYYNDLKYTKENIYSDKEEQKKALNNIKKTYEKRKENNQQLFHLFIIIDESCELMKMEGTSEILKEITKDCDKVGIHFIIATNSANENFFDKELIESIKHKVTFDLTSKAEANWLNIKNSQNLKTPGEAIASSKNQNIRIKLQTPYISTEDILTIVNYLKFKNK